MSAGLLLSTRGDMLRPERWNYVIRALALGIVAVAMQLGLASTASAASITYTLNCTFSGHPATSVCGAPNGPFGTVTLSDNPTNANWVDISVSLLPEAGLDAFLKNLFLNYSGPDPNGNPEYEWLKGNTIDKITFKPNDVGEFHYNYLDVEVSAEGHLVNPWTGTIMLKQKNTNTYFDLDPSTFSLVTNDPQAANAAVYLAVLREVTTQPSSTFTLIGALGNPEGQQQQQQVPEPTMLALLAGGFLGMAGHVLLRSRHKSLPQVLRSAGTSG